MHYIALLTLNGISFNDFVTTRSYLSFMSYTDYNNPKSHNEKEPYRDVKDWLTTWDAAMLTSDGFTTGWSGTSWFGKDIHGNNYQVSDLGYPHLIFALQTDPDGPYLPLGAMTHDEYAAVFR